MVLVPLVLAVGILFVVVFSPLYPGRPEFAALVGWWVEDPAILPLFLLGWMAAVALLTFSDRLKHPVLTWLALVVPVIVSILLYDDGQFVVHDHYQPYVGSATKSLPPAKSY